MKPMIRETLNLVFVIDGELNEIQTNSYEQIKAYVNESTSYMITNFEGTIISCKGITELLTLTAKSYDREKERREEAFRIMRSAMAKA